MSSQVVDEFSPCGALTIAGRIGWMSASELVVEAVSGREEFVSPGTKVCALTFNGVLHEAEYGDLSCIIGILLCH